MAVLGRRRGARSIIPLELGCASPGGAAGRPFESGELSPRVEAKDLRMGGAEDVGTMTNGDVEVTRLSAVLSKLVSAVRPGGKEGVGGLSCSDVLGRIPIDWGVCSGCWRGSGLDDLIPRESKSISTA